MNIRPYIPRLILHVLDSESKTATLGFMIYGAATYGCFIAREPGLNGLMVPIIDSDKWLLCMAISSTLIGGKLIGETVLSIKNGGKSANAPTQPSVAA